jgi:hypothetical protein
MTTIRIINTLSRALFAASALALSGAALAANVAVYEDVDFFDSKGRSSESFLIDTAGVYKATLTDFKFPGSFSGNFGLMVSTSNSALDSTMGPGSFTFHATPGTYWASVFGVTSAPLDLGLYGIRIEQIMAAPLPGAMLLLMSALVVLYGAGRGGIRIGKRDPEVPFGAAMA